jgi:imidazolonepropionase-like amidohydrolase
MAFGTDAGVYPHGDNAKQFKYMVEYGMKPVDAIRSATLNAAELLGRTKEIGVVAKDAFADVIAVQGDPRTDATLLENVRFVMKGGKVYKNLWAR